MNEDYIHQWKMRELMKIPANRKLAIDRLSKKLEDLKPEKTKVNKEVQTLDKLLEVIQIARKRF